MALPCWFNWQQIYEEQFPSYAGNPATVVEITNGQTESSVFAVEEIHRLGLEGRIQFFACTDEESESFAANFKDGGCSFVFIDGVHNHERTLANLRTWGPKVHYNSAMAGHGIRIPEVRRAVEDFCKESPVPLPWRLINECWQINHMHRPGQTV